jgi:cytochrome b6
MTRAVAAIREWLDERLDLDDLLAPLRHKTVPVHYYSHWYYLGGITLFLFMVQVGTGMLLLLYYKPSAGEAFESVQYIVTQVQFGWLIRSVHSWSANLMVFTAFAHMFSVLFLRAYRPPREMTWLSGMLLLFLTLGFGFSGYLLPWNELAFFATKVGTDIAGQVPVVGHAIKVFLRGGEDVTGATLTRFFGFHVALLPGITTVLVAVHLFLVQRQGISVPPSLERAMHVIKYLRKHDPAAAELILRGAEDDVPREMPFFPNFFLRELMAWYIAVAVLGILAALAPWELGAKADPFASAPAGIRPEWYFMFMFETLKLIPAKIWFIDGELIGVLAFGAAGLVWLFLPFFDRGTSRSRHLIFGLGIFALAYMMALTAYGYLHG